MLRKLFTALMWLGIFKPFHAAPIQIKTIKTINEFGPANACGHWSVCNASALEKHADTFDKLNSGQILSQAQQDARLYVPGRAHQLASDEVEALAKKAGLLSLVLGKYPNGQIAPLIWNGSGDFAVYQKVVAKITKMLHKDEASFVLPCICNIGGYHWVMLAIVKREAQQPFMVFMDNCNGSEAAVQPFISYLKKTFSLQG